MKNKRGLRVCWCENVASYKSNGYRSLINAAVPDAWRIQVWRGGRWYCVMDLRFLREKDALRAAYALTVAGLDSITALEKADPIMVKQVATEHLQW